MTYHPRLDLEGNFYYWHRVSTQLQLTKYIISYHIISYHIISYHIISYHIISYHIIISYHYIISYHISYHIISYHIISYHTIPYHIFFLKVFLQKDHVYFCSCSFVPHTHAQLIFLYLIILLCCEDYTQPSSSLCSYSHPHTT